MLGPIPPQLIPKKFFSRLWQHVHDENIPLHIMCHLNAAADSSHQRCAFQDLDVDSRIKLEVPIARHIGVPGQEAPLLAYHSPQFHILCRRGLDANVSLVWHALATRSGACWLAVCLS